MRRGWWARVSNDPLLTCPRVLPKTPLPRFHRTDPSEGESKRCADAMLVQKTQKRQNAKAQRARRTNPIHTGVCKALRFLTAVLCCLFFILHASLLLCVRASAPQTRCASAVSVEGACAFCAASSPSRVCVCACVVYPTKIHTQTHTPSARVSVAVAWKLSPPARLLRN